MSRARGLMIAVCLLSLAFAGCTGGGDDDAGQGASGPTTAAAPGDPQGDILGSVVTDEGTPIEGAEVTILSLEITNRTAADGSFAFAGVPAGKHVVAASKLGYQSAAKSVQVDDGATVEVNLELAPIAIKAEPYHLSYPYEGKITCGTLLVPWCGIFQDLQEDYGTPNPSEDHYFFSWNWNETAEYPVSQVIEVSWTPTTGVTGQNLNPLYLTTGPEVADQHVIFSAPTEGLPSPIYIEVDQDALESANSAYPESDFGFGVYPPLSELVVEQRFSIWRTDFFVDPHPEGFTALPTE